MASPLWRHVAQLLLWSVGVAAKHSAKPMRWVIVSQPSKGSVLYMPIKDNGNLGPSSVLLSGGLIHPQGVAVDSKRNALLVADPTKKQINSYPLTFSGTSLVAGSPFLVANGTEARWVTADNLGNIFFTDEVANKIYRVSSDNSTGGSGVLYDGAVLTGLNGPGGIAADTFYTYWVNKHLGKQVGSLARGAMEPDPSNVGASVTALTKNSDKSYGVCLALSNVYYTQPNSIIYGVKKTGGATATINDRLTNPRGCAWDGDGTVYVADRGANALFAFAGNQETLQAVTLVKAADVTDAFGVTVFSGAVRPYAAAVWVVFVGLFQMHLFFLN